MADTDFPTIKTPDPASFSQKLIRQKYISKLETGRILSRVKHDGGTWEFTLSWPETCALPDADYVTLATFFNTDSSTLFNWTHPKLGIVFECIFLDDELPEAKPLYGHWTLTGLRIGQLGPS